MKSQLTESSCAFFFSSSNPPNCASPCWKLHKKSLENIWVLIFQAGLYTKSHKPKSYRIFEFIKLKLLKYLDQGGHKKIIKSLTIILIKKIPSWVVVLSLLFVFKWTLEDLRVHYSEAPTAYWCDRRCGKPTAAPTLDISLHIRKAACRGWTGRNINRKTKSQSGAYVVGGLWVKFQSLF